MILQHTALARFEACRQIHGAADRTKQCHGHSFLVMAQHKTLPQENLAQAISCLNYADLNTVLAQPDDIALSYYIQQQLPEDSLIWLRSAPFQGTILQNDDVFCWIEKRFEAAHFLPNVPIGHKCGRLHGHGFIVKLIANAQNTTIVELEKAWTPYFNQLHLHCLNTLEDLCNPTSENLAKWLYDRIKETLPTLAWVEVNETRSSGSQFDGETFRIWKEQYFDSALPSPISQQIMGHTYLVRLMLSGQIDTVMGWIADYGDIKQRFDPFYQRLDHHPLHGGLSLAPNHPVTDANLAQWIYAQLTDIVPQLKRVDTLSSAYEGASLYSPQDMRFPLLYTYP